MDKLGDWMLDRAISKRKGSGVAFSYLVQVGR